MIAKSNNSRDEAALVGRASAIDDDPEDAASTELEESAEPDVEAHGLSGFNLPE